MIKPKVPVLCALPLLLTATLVNAQEPTSEQQEKSPELPERIFFASELTGDVLDPLSFSRALEIELGLPESSIDGKIEGPSIPRLLVYSRNGSIVVRYRDPQSVERERETNLPSQEKVDQKMLIWFCSNVIRDQSSEFVPISRVSETHPEVEETKAPEKKEVAVKSKKRPAYPTNRFSHWYVAPHLGVSAWENTFALRLTAGLRL